jgi:hypothetical protein
VVNIIYEITYCFVRYLTTLVTGRGFLVSWGGVSLSALGTSGTTDLLYHLQMIDDACGAVGGMRITTGNRVKGKVKLSPCLTNEALRHEGVRGSGCIDPHFLDLGTSWR